MPDFTRVVAMACAPVMAAVAWLLDSPDDRRDRLRQAEVLLLWRQLQGRQRVFGEPPGRRRRGDDHKIRTGMSTGGSGTDPRDERSNT